MGELSQVRDVLPCLPSNVVYVAPLSGILYTFKYFPSSQRCRPLDGDRALRLQLSHSWKPDI